MTMTKTDYELIGNTLGNEVGFLQAADAAPAADVVQAMASVLADALEADNPKFDRTRFLNLVGVTE